MRFLVVSFSLGVLGTLGITPQTQAQTSSTEAKRKTTSSNPTEGTETRPTGEITKEPEQTQSSGGCCGDSGGGSSSSSK